MENHRLGIHNYKMCADSSTGNTPNTQQFIWPIYPNRPIIWDISEKSSHHMSIVHGHKKSKELGNLLRLHTFPIN